MHERMKCRLFLSHMCFSNLNSPFVILYLNLNWEKWKLWLTKFYCSAWLRAGFPENIQKLNFFEWKYRKMSHCLEKWWNLENMKMKFSSFFKFERSFRPSVQKVSALRLAEFFMTIKISFFTYFAATKRWIQNTILGGKFENVSNCWPFFFLFFFVICPEILVEKAIFSNLLLLEEEISFFPLSGSGTAATTK